MLDTPWKYIVQVLVLVLGLTDENSTGTSTSTTYYRYNSTARMYYYTRICSKSVQYVIKEIASMERLP